MHERMPELGIAYVAALVFCWTCKAIRSHDIAQEIFLVGLILKQEVAQAEEQIRMILLLEKDYLKSFPEIIAIGMTYAETSGNRVTAPVFGIFLQGSE